MAKYLVGLDLRPEVAQALSDTARSNGLYVDDLLMLFCEALEGEPDPEDIPVRAWIRRLSPVGACGSFVEWEACHGSPCEMGTTLRLIREAEAALDDAFTQYFTAEDEMREDPAREGAFLEAQAVLKEAQDKVRRLETLEDEIYSRYKTDITASYGKDHVWSLESCIDEVERYEGSRRSFEVDGITTPAGEELKRRIQGGGFSPVG